MSTYTLPYNTCPLINQNLNYIKEQIETDIESFLLDNFPFLDGEKLLNKLTSGLRDTIFDNIKDEIENVRECNSDLRQKFEEIIEKQDEEITELLLEIKELKEKE